MLSGRGLCDELITRPEDPYRLWRVVLCDQETSKNEEAKARYWAAENTTTMDCNAKKTNTQITIKLLFKKENESSQNNWLPVNLDINVNFSVLVAAILN
jgi:hypothetical protein